MRLLVWTQYFWPENFRINELTIGLSRAGINVVVLTGKPNYPAGKVFPGYKVIGVQREFYSGIEIVRVPVLPRGKANAIRLFLNYFSFILSGYLFAPLALKGKDIDAIFVYAPSPLLQAIPAVFLSWFKRAPLIVWVQDLWPESLQATGFLKNRLSLKLVEFAVKYIYRFSDLILIQSEGFRDPVGRLVKDVEKIVFYPNSSEDLSNDVRAVVADNFLVSSIARNFSIVFAGNIGKAQACETIVFAAELLRDRENIKFFIIGDGSQAPAIASEVKKRGLTNVVLPGRLPSELMSSLFSVASVLLVSLRDDAALSATLPSKLQSYLSAGKPIIASLNGEAARVVVEADAGLVCPAENPHALAACVSTLYSMPKQERERFGKNGLSYFRAHFDLKQQVGKLISHLDKLVGR
jgi:glycosyltransferase involved in cell wall biosynthesis